MDCSDIVTISASLIALAGSLVSLFISTSLAAQKERRQLLWSKELDRFFQLEELAGDVLECMGRYTPIPEEGSESIQKFEALAQSAGRFARYPEVRQAIRDLHSTLNRMYVAKRDREDDERKIRAELDPAFDMFLGACDRVTGRKGRVCT